MRRLEYEGLKRARGRKTMVSCVRGKESDGLVRAGEGKRWSRACEVQESVGLVRAKCRNISARLAVALFRRSVRLLA